MPNIFEEFHPLSGKIFCILDENGNLRDEYAPNFSDDELKAIWVYLQSVPKHETTIP